MSDGSTIGSTIDLIFIILDFMALMLFVMFNLMFFGAMKRKYAPSPRMYAKTYNQGFWKELPEDLKFATNKTKRKEIKQYLLAFTISPLIVYLAIFLMTFFMITSNTSPDYWQPIEFIYSGLLILIFIVLLIASPVCLLLIGRYFLNKKSAYNSSQKEAEQKLQQFIDDWVQKYGTNRIDFKLKTKIFLFKPMNIFKRFTPKTIKKMQARYKDDFYANLLVTFDNYLRMGEAYITQLYFSRDFTKRGYAYINDNPGNVLNVDAFKHILLHNFLTAVYNGLNEENKKSVI